MGVTLGIDNLRRAVELEVRSPDFKRKILASFNPLDFLFVHWDRCGKQRYSPGIAIWDGEE